VALAEAGADVVISARSADQLARVAAQVEAAGRRALVIPADLSDLDAAAGLAAAAADAFGRLDIVVNNVGGAMPRPFPATKPRHPEAAFHFNVAVAHALTQAAMPHLLAAAGEEAPAGAGGEVPAGAREEAPAGTGNGGEGDQGAGPRADGAPRVDGGIERPNLDLGIPDL
jgi:short-subunit dehydrogenase